MDDDRQPWRGPWGMTLPDVIVLIISVLVILYVTVSMLLGAFRARSNGSRARRDRHARPGTSAARQPGPRGS
ncbi:MAG: hypothetical protein ACOC8E_06330 [Planctomycetota bacterium]